MLNAEVAKSKGMIGLIRKALNNNNNTINADSHPDTKLHTIGGTGTSAASVGT